MAWVHVIFIKQDDDQNREMSDIVEKISEHNFIDDLFAEGDKHGAGQMMKDLWEMDKSNIRKEYEKDQKEHGKQNG